MSSDAPSDAVNPESRTVTADVLGARFAFEVDPDRLNEAGVVWDVAVRACAEAMEPMIRRAQSKISASSKYDSTNEKHKRGDDEVTGLPFVNVLELGAGTGALGIALASVERTRVFVTDLEPVVGLAAANAKRNGSLLHATSCVKAGALPWSVEPGSVPDPCVVFGDDLLDRGDEKKTDDGDTAPRDDRWHFVAACETLYWGGWDVFAEDTRAPQLAIMVEACRMGSQSSTCFDSVLVVAFTVRDVKRETLFLLEDVGEKFWFSRMDDDFHFHRDSHTVSNKLKDTQSEGVEETSERADARARAYIENASEGDLLVFRGRLKERRRST